MLSTLLDNLKLLGMEIMQTILPAIKEFVEKALKFTQRLRDMNERTKKLILIVAGLTAAIGPLMIALGGLITMLNFLAAAGGPIMWVIAAIGLLVTAGVLLYTHWEKVSRFLEQIWVNIATTAQQIFQAVKIAVLQPLIDILNGLRFIGRIFGAEGTKISNAIRALTNEQTKSIDKITELGDRRREANKTAKALREEEKKLAEVQAKMNEVLITAPSLVEDYIVKIDDLTEAEEELLHNINHTSERLHAADNAAFEAAKSTDKYSNAMQRLGDRARLLEQGIPEVTEKIDEFEKALKTAEEALQTTEEFFSEHWQNMWEIMGDQTLSGADKVKKVFQNLLADLLRMYGDYLKKMGLAMMLLNPVAGIGFLTASALAYMGAGAIASLAKGGIVTQPTLALIGESGPEAVVPLNKGGGIGMNIYITVQGSVQKEKDLAQSLAYEINRQRYLTA